MISASQPKRSHPLAPARSTCRFCGCWARGLLAAVCLLIGADAGWSQRASLEERINSQQEQIKKIENDIKKHRSKSRALRQEETNVLKQLSSLEQEIALSGQFLASLVERQALLEEKIDSLEANIVFESEILNYQRKRLSLRLRQMYMRGPSYSWDILLGSGDIEAMLRRYKFLKLVAERDADLIERVTVNKLVLERERAEKTETLADIAVLRTQKQEEDGRLQKNKTDRKSALKRVRSEKSQHLQAIEELKRSQEKLMELITDLEKRRLEKKDIGELDGSRFARLRGKLAWPVKGKVIKHFGKDRHPEFGTVTYNNGIDIRAPKGAPIRSVATGRVELVDWIVGYGNCIIINHGGGYYTLYAHADNIFVALGQNVAVGEVIAEVGDSGSLNGYECHFEIRKSKQALNPSEWLARK